MVGSTQLVESPQTEIEPAPSALESEALTTELSGKSLSDILKSFNCPSTNIYPWKNL